MFAKHKSAIRAADRFLLLNVARIDVVGTLDRLRASSESFGKLAQHDCEAVEVESYHLPSFAPTAA
jgi:hypothetical protein